VTTTVTFCLPVHGAPVFCRPSSVWSGEARNSRKRQRVGHPGADAGESRRRCGRGRLTWRHSKAVRPASGMVPASVICARQQALERTRGGTERAALRCGLCVYSARRAPATRLNGPHQGLTFMLAGFSPVCSSESSAYCAIVPVTPATPPPSAHTSSPTCRQWSERGRIESANGPLDEHLQARDALADCNNGASHVHA
jgi:hypothetical protein